MSLLGRRDVDRPLRNPGGAGCSGPGNGGNCGVHGKIGNGQPGLDSIGIGACSDLTPWLFVELAGIRRLTTQPNGANTSPLVDYMLFSRVAVHY